MAVPIPPGKKFSTLVGVIIIHARTCTGMREKKFFFFFFALVGSMGTTALVLCVRCSLCAIFWLDYVSGLTRGWLL